jgi:hypothetical protein
VHKILQVGIKTHVQSIKWSFIEGYSYSWCNSVDDLKNQLIKSHIQAVIFYVSNLNDSHCRFILRLKQSYRNIKWVVIHEQSEVDLNFYIKECILFLAQKEKLESKPILKKFLNCGTYAQRKESRQSCSGGCLMTNSPLMPGALNIRIHGLILDISRLGACIKVDLSQQISVGDFVSVKFKTKKGEILNYHARVQWLGEACKVGLQFMAAI